MEKQHLRKYDVNDASVVLYGIGVFGDGMRELYSNFQGYLQLNIPRIKWVLLFGIIFFVLFCFLCTIGCIKRYKTKRVPITCDILLSFDCSFIVVMTLFTRRIGDTYKIDLKPFSSYYVAFAEGNMEILLQILVNIAMYIPLGFLLPCCFKLFEKYRYVILGIFSGSLVIELIQLIFRLGLFEVDDVINNTLGAVIGLVIYIIFKRGKE